MAESGEVFNQAINAPSMPTVPEDHSAPNATGRSSQSSTGACDACRLRKVRCLANESSSSSRCQRCARANRECVYTTHSKTRRRKRTDTRVKELEEKVHGLSMLLENGRGGSGSSAEREIESMEDEERNRRRTSNETDTLHTDGEVCPRKDFIDQSETQPSENIVSKWGPNSEEVEPESMWPDVVDRSLLSIDKATELVNRYNNLLLPHYPAVPISCPAHKLRQTKPILFLAVLAASAEASDQTLQYKLNQEIQQLYARKIAVQGHKSLELIQALCVSIAWTYPPKKFEELKYHQQIHMAATMALDIGLGKRPKPNSDPYPTLEVDELGALGKPGEKDISHHIALVRQALDRKRASDSSSVEGRRALLACYVFCAGVSMSLRLPNMLRFTTWMADCVDFLETSPEAAPMDRIFAAQVRLQHIVEDCGISLGFDNSDDTISLDDERAQLMLKGGEKQLAAWKNQATSNGILNNFLEIIYHVNNIYLHEIALHTDHDAEDFQPPYSLTAKTPSSKKLSPPNISAIMECVNSSQRLIGLFLTMGVEAVRAAPTLLCVRLCYAIVILMKLSISASTPSSELGKVLKSEDCKVLHYIEKVIPYMDAIATVDSQRKHVLAYKFLHILTNLNIWFQKQTLQLNTKSGPDRTLTSHTHGQAKQGSQNLASSMSMSVPHSLLFSAMTSSTATASGCQAVSQDSDPAPCIPQSFSEPNFSYNDSKSPVSKAFDSSALEPAPAPWTQAPAWSNEVQPSSEFQEQNYSFASFPNGPFDFPMEIDPNLFSQLANNELYENSGGNVMLNRNDGMVYTDMPEVDWTSWPHPL